MSSRAKRSHLEKLLDLLQDSKDQGTLDRAARKIRDVVCQHPQQLPAILRQLHQVLYSKVWEARVAAAEALALVASAIAHWSAQQLAEAVSRSTANAAGSAEAVLQEAHVLQSFDVKSVLSCGSALLSDDGRDESGAEECRLDARSRVGALKNRLGFGRHCETARAAHGDDAGCGLAVDSEAQAGTDDAGEPVQSAMPRRRNTSKRKASNATAIARREDDAHEEATCKSYPAPAAAMWLATEEAQAQDAPEDDHNASGRWPFQLIADRLLCDLLDATWEVRHGAALGLRQILSHHAPCAGVSVPVSDPLSGWHMSGGSGRMTIAKPDAAAVHTAAQQHACWLQDALALLLSSLVLDRFADYVSDQVTAPVREAAAQALALVAAELGSPQRVQLLQLLVSLQCQDLWEVRHAAMLAVKHLLIASAADADKLIAVAMPALMAAMHEADDDVRVAAAQACLPAVDTIAGMGADTVGALLHSLWAMLPQLSDISAATASVLQLLGALQSRCAQSVASTASLQTVLPSLLPLFRHQSSDVQLEACACARVLCRAAFSAHSVGSAAEHAALVRSVASLLHLAYQTVLTSEHASVAQAAEEVFQCVLQHCPKPALGAALDAQLIQILAGLPCLSPSEPLDNGYTFVVDAVGVEPPAKRARTCGEPAALYIGAGIVGTTEGLRVRCARLFAGCLAACASQVGDAACQMAATNAQNLMGTFLQQYSVAAQAFAATVYFFWLMSLFAPTTAVPMDVHTQLYEALERAPSLPLQELASPHSDMIAKLAALLHALSRANMPAAFPPGVALDTIDAAYASTILEAIGPSVPADDAQGVAPAFEAASVAVSRLTDVAVALRCHLSAAIAAACAAWRELPERVTALVQPLMAGLRNITDRSTQQHVLAPAMAELMVASASRTPCPNSKILRHLGTLACRHSADATDPASHQPTPVSSPPPEMLSETSGALHSDVLSLAPPQDIAAHDAGRAASTAVLRCLAERTGAALPELLPHLWEMLTAPAAAFAAADEGAANADVSHALTSAQLLRIVAAVLHTSVHQRLSPHLPQLVACMERAGTTQATSAIARSLAALAAAQPAIHLEGVVSHACALMDKRRAPEARHAGVALLLALLEPANALTQALLPYLPLLVTPALACMSDPQRALREPAAAAFGRLMALLPLAALDALPPTPTLPPELRTKLEADAAFLRQLLEASSVAPFEPPVMPRDVEFRGYQRDGIAWLAFLRRFGLHGILADDMGLGKTLQTLTIVVAAMHDAQVGGGGGGRQRAAPSLVVCPASLVGHWTAEAQRYFGHCGIDAIAVQGTPAQRATAQQRVAARGVRVLAVTSYETVRASSAWLAQQTFEYCVLDEGHIIRNPKAKVSRACKQIVARHRLLLSGTPIQNNARELWSLFDFLMPGLLGSEADFSRRFRATAPPGVNATRKSVIKAQSALEGALEELHQQVLPFVLHRTKEQVLQDLPPKLMQDLFCDMSPLQQTLYASATAVQQGGAAWDPTTAAQSDSLELLGFLRKLCTHPCLALDWQRPDHAAAVHAALPALSGVATEAAGDALARLEHSPKLQALQQLLLDCGVIAGPSPERDEGCSRGAADAAGHRVLIFAQLRGTLDLVESTVLAPADTSFVRLDGAVKASERQALVQRFNGDPTIGVMLLTTAVGSLGLNLTSADTVVFLEHDWNPMKDMQAMDRAHRLGQKRVVTVYRLLMRGTLEERIMSLQHFKKGVAAAVVNTDNVATDSMATGDVLDLVGQGVATAGDRGAAKR